MVEPFVGAAAGEVAKAGGGVLSRLLGPTADDMGLQLQEWYRQKNVERVVKRAERKANTASDGAIPPRVAAEVFDKAQWADDEFVAEYLSGVLASSRTPDGSDDSGISWTALVGRLSSTQLRLHYVLYSTARHHLIGRPITAIHELDEYPIFVPLPPVLALLEGGADAFNEAFMNLTREGLISDRAEIDATGKNLLAGKVVPPGPVMIYRISSPGLMLFMRGGGSRETRVRAIASSDEALSFEGVGGIPVPIPGSSLRDELPDKPTEESDSAGVD